MAHTVLMAQLEAFVEVCRTGNLSQAAETLYVTQPALTARVRGLEAELDAQLFVRTSRGMRVTDIGRAFLPYAERALASVVEGHKLVADLQAGTAGELLIGAAPAVSTYVLPSILKAFQSAHPKVRLGVRTGHTEEVLEMVIGRDVHIGLGRPIQHRDVELIPAFEDEMMLVVGARHRFVPRGRVRLDELATERLILFDRTSSYYELTSALFRGAGVVPESVMELDNVEAAKKMVQLGLGAALLPRMALSAELRARSLRPIRIVGAAALRRPIVALRRRDAGQPSGAVADLLAMLTQRSPAG
jgi:DNA-binding transcriptional LysR family regulator